MITDISFMYLALDNLSLKDYQGFSYVQYVICCFFTVFISFNTCLKFSKVIFSDKQSTIRNKFEKIFLYACWLFELAIMSQPLLALCLCTRSFDLMTSVSRLCIFQFYTEHLLCMYLYVYVDFKKPYPSRTAYQVSVLPMVCSM